MYKKLRILFTCISALALVGLFPMGLIFDTAGIVACVLVAGIFFMLMLLCKQAQEKREPTSMENPNKEGLEEEKQKENVEKE